MNTQNTDKMILKIKSRHIIGKLNDMWNDSYHTWFSICDVQYCHSLLWTFGHNYSYRTILEEFHCMNWKDIGDNRDDIAGIVIKYIDSPYVKYRHNQFYFYDMDAVKAEQERKSNLPPEVRSKIMKFFERIFGRHE